MLSNFDAETIKGMIKDYLKDNLSVVVSNNHGKLRVSLQLNGEEISSDYTYVDDNSDDYY